MKIYDSVKRDKVLFEPVKEGEARIYVCGPTVYDDAHLGHARSAIAFDLLRRVLKAKGYRVTFMKNFTDIDDKIINKSNNTGESIESITAKYIDSYLRDMEKLGIERPDSEPKATENLVPMADMIEKLLKQDIAYKTSNGDIYFDTSKDEKYGSISGRQDEESDAQSRVEGNEEKRNWKDFVLWKAYKGEGDVGYESPLGKGRPGWHTECCAMIDNELAYDADYAIDIHAGGMDLLFPHHENEATQTRCANHQEIAKYWMHNGFVTIHGEKMSKSLGNSFFVKDALRVHDGEVLRFYLLSAHYRAPLHFNEEDLLGAKKRLDKIYRLRKRVSDSQPSELSKMFQEKMLSALGDDLNVSLALSVIDELIHSANDELDANPKNKALKKETLANLEWMAELLGIGGRPAHEYFQIGVSEEQKAVIETKINERTEAKKDKNFEEADRIRDELIGMGVGIMDTPQGTVWEKL